MIYANVEIMKTEPAEGREEGWDISICLLDLN